MNNTSHIPRLAARLLNGLCKSEYIEEIIGDLHEYQDELSDKSGFKRRLYFWFHVFNFLRPWALKRPLSKISPSPVMYRHYFKFAFRGLLRRRTASIINISGLLAGMTAVLLIGLWVHDELSFNTYHPKYDRLAKVLRSQTHLSERSIGENQPFALASELRLNYADHFESVAMMVGWSTEHAIGTVTNSFLEEGRFIEPSSVEILGLEMRDGNLKAIEDPRSILLSASFAKKLFSEKDPIGEIVDLDGKADLLVAGIYADLPKNSEFYGIHYLIHFDQFYEQNPWAEANSWLGSNVTVYALLHDGISVDQANKAIAQAMLPHIGEETREARNPELSLQPMSRWHLHSNLDDRPGAMSAELRFVWFYASIGFFILLLASINFVNLSTARFIARTKEVGVRKTMGSSRNQLISQFLVESFLLVFIALIISIGFSYWVLPWFNAVADKAMVLPLGKLGFWLVIIASSVFVALLAGYYPAIFLSSIQVVKALRGKLFEKRQSLSLRKVLVVFQFTITIALIAGTLVIFRQVTFVQDRDEGYDKQGLIMVKMVTDDYKGRYGLLRDELLKSGMVAQVGGSGAPVTDDQYNNNGFTWKGKHPDFNPIFNDFYSSPEFGETIGWQILDGRDFKAGFASDQSAVLINESTAALLGFENPVGETLTWESREGKSYTIIGVVKDMVRASPFAATPPSLFFLSTELPWLHMRIASGVEISQAVTGVESVVENILPNEPFDYRFVDDVYKAKFIKEERMGSLSSFFTILALAISGLGMFGLATYEVVRRTKEIGVRKVLGASVMSLWSILSKDLLSLVLLSSVVAIPIAWFLLDDWLARYEYHVSLEWWMLATASVGAIVLGLVSISYQSLKVAFSNPVHSLRTE